MITVDHLALPLPRLGRLNLISYSDNGINNLVPVVVVSLRATCYYPLMPFPWGQTMGRWAVFHLSPFDVSMPLPYALRRASLCHHVCELDTTVARD